MLPGRRRPPRPPLDPARRPACGTIGGVPPVAPRPADRGLSRAAAPSWSRRPARADRTPAPRASCARLFEVTLRGLREEAATDAARRRRGRGSPTPPTTPSTPSPAIRRGSRRARPAGATLGRRRPRPPAAAARGVADDDRRRRRRPRRHRPGGARRVLGPGGARGLDGRARLGPERDASGRRPERTNTFRGYAATVGDLMDRRARKKAQTRELIRTVAQRLFAERGFDAVTIADIAREADVAVQTVFNHFATKEELFFDGRTPWVDGAGRRGPRRAPRVAPLTALRAHLVDARRRPRSARTRCPERRCYIAHPGGLGRAARLRARTGHHEAERRLRRGPARGLGGGPATPRRRDPAVVGAADRGHLAGRGPRRSSSSSAPR